MLRAEWTMQEKAVREKDCRCGGEVCRNTSYTDNTGVHRRPVITEAAFPWLKNELMVNRKSTVVYRNTGTKV